MKSKEQRTETYRIFIKTISLRMGFLAMIAVLSVVLLRAMGRGYIGNVITSVICRIMALSWEEGRAIYLTYVQSNIDTIMVLTMILFFILFVRFLLSWFTSYFDQIVRGVEALAEESPGPVVMCSELHFMEVKLNQVRNKLQRRKETARLAEQRKDELVVYLAHDIKTPLTSVIGYLNLLDENPGMPREQRAKYVHITLDKAYRLESLINEFFEITRYNMENVPLNKKDIDLYYMIQQLTEEMYPLLEESGKTVEVKMDEAVSAYGDPDKLARVFHNLLKNAVSYSIERSTIEVTAKRTDTHTDLFFKSQGTIPKEKLTSIFEKFYRLDDSRSSATGGAGLGLAIAKDIVTLHGGSIEAACDEVSTTFHVSLPNEKGTVINARTS